MGLSEERCYLVLLSGLITVSVFLKQTG